MLKPPIVGFSIFVIAWTSSLSADEPQDGYTESPEVMQIVEKFNNRLRHYHGLEFEYEISFEAEGNRGDEYLVNSGESINRLRILNPIEEDGLQYRLYWEKNVENPGEPLFDQDRITETWVAYDGQESRRFLQTFLTKPKSHLASSGSIYPGQYVGGMEIGGDCFLEFISNDIYHSMTYRRSFDPADLLGRFKVTLAGQKKYLGKDCVVANFDPLPSLEIGKPHFSLLTENGVPMVLHTEGGEYGGIRDFGFVKKVTRVDEFEGTEYPAEGYYVMSLGNSMKKGEFKVLNVRRLSDTETSNWFPEWNPGTTVFDEINDTVTRIPYTAEQQDTIRRFMLKRTAISAIGWGSVTMLLFNLTAVGIIGYFVYRKVRASFS